MLENMSFIRIWEGENIIIDAIQINKNCPVKDFLDNELQNNEARKLHVLFRLLDQQKGRVTNKQKLKKLRFTCENCFELKPTGQVRISFIYLKETNHICLLDGFKKKQDKWPRNKIKKTERLCKIARRYEK